MVEIEDDARFEHPTVAEEDVRGHCTNPLKVGLTGIVVIQF